MVGGAWVVVVSVAVFLVIWLVVLVGSQPFGSK
jgi:hypothetical protein